jgi:FMN phosphatase YigB (HAD superfamily)
MSTEHTKRVVVWDVDDVLNELMREWFEDWWRPRHPECTHDYADISANPPHSVLGISEAAYLSSLDEFREARFAALMPRPEVLQWFREHGHRAHHVALSAPPEAFAHASAAWVIRHFGQWIRTYAFVPARRGRTDVADPRVAKRNYLEWLGHGDVFLDDRADNVQAARSLGMTGIVLPQPWSTSPHQSFRGALAQLTSAIDHP